MSDFQSTNRALSIRQPWAHRILFEGKDIENRPWSTKRRGWVLIHAGKAIDDDERENVTDDMHRGGIVGAVRIIDCVSASDSEWFSGPWGFVLADPTPLKFVPCSGALSFFTPDLDGSTLVNIEKVP